MLINVIYTAVKQQAGELLSLHSFKPFLMAQIMEKDSKPQYYSPYPVFLKRVTKYCHLYDNPKLLSMTSTLSGTLKTTYSL